MGRGAIVRTYYAASGGCASRQFQVKVGKETAFHGRRRTGCGLLSYHTGLDI